jgi:hypothetical protein
MQGLHPADPPPPVEFDLTSLPVALLSRGHSKFEPCQSRKYDEKKYDGKSQIPWREIEITSSHAAAGTKDTDDAENDLVHRLPF